MAQAMASFIIGVNMLDTARRKFHFRYLLKRATNKQTFIRHGRSETDSVDC